MIMAVKFKHEWKKTHINCFASYSYWQKMIQLFIKVVADEDLKAMESSSWVILMVIQLA